MTEAKRILLVEDKAEDIELTLAALAKHDLAKRVAVARDGVEALDYLYCRGKFNGRPGGNPGVVLLDIKMPRLDGLEVLRRIKSDDQLKSLPVVILTSSCEESDLSRSYALGANAYVVKPVIFQHFIDAIKQVGVFWAMLNELPAN